MFGPFIPYYKKRHDKIIVKLSRVKRMGVQDVAENILGDLTWGAEDSKLLVSVIVLHLAISFTKSES